MVEQSCCFDTFHFALLNSIYSYSKKTSSNSNCYTSTARNTISCWHYRSANSSLPLPKGHNRLHQGIAWFSTGLSFNTQLQLNTIISWTSEELLLFSRVEGHNGRSLPLHVTLAAFVVYVANYPF